MSPQPIETAPEGDGWILGLVQGDGAPSGERQPWVILTRCDGGWADDDGHIRTPTAWVPLPDPQPEPSGWHPAEGTIWISPWQWRDQSGNLIADRPWTVHIIKLDGEPDLYRECWPCRSIDHARERAAKWHEQYGLPVQEEPAPKLRLVASSHETRP